MAERTARTKQRYWWPGLALVLLLGLAAGGWVLLRSGVESGSPAPTSLTLTPGVATLVTAAQLRELAATHAPLYWAGERPGTKLEVTTTTKNALFVRYLPDDVAAGDPGEFLTVGTYDAIEGYSALIGASSKVADIEKATTGAVIATFGKQPRSTYFSFPRAAFQVEVFSPKTGESRRLTEAGEVQLVEVGR